MKSAVSKATLQQQEKLKKLFLQAVESGEVEDENGLTRTAADLLKSGADVNAINDKGEAALHLAFCSRNMATILALLEHPKIELNKEISSPYGSYLPLVGMIDDDPFPEKKEIISAILKHPNFDINKPDDGNAPLHKSLTSLEAEGLTGVFTGIGTTEIFSSILAHPDIAVNVAGVGGLNVLQKVSRRANIIFEDTRGGVLSTPRQTLALNNLTEALNKIITSTVASKRDEGADWKFMQQADQLGSYRVQKFLDRKTVTLLAVILPAGDLRDLTIKNFNERNPEVPLNQENNGAIAKLRELKALLVIGFSELKNCPAIETSANIAIQDIVMNSDGLKSVRNYQQREKVSKRGIAVDEENPIGWIMANPKLDVAQNHVLEEALQVLLKGLKTPPTTIKKSSSKKIDQTNQTACCVIS